MTIERAFASASDTLDQTSYTQVDSMTLSPGVGDYLVIFNMQVQFAVTPGTTELLVAVYLAGSQQAHSVRGIDQNSSLNDMYWGVGTTALVSLTGSEAVEIRYIASVATTPMVGTTRELNMFPADFGTNYQDTDTVTDTIATATWTTLDTMTRTPANGDYLLIFSATCEAPAAGNNIGFRLSVGGSPVAHTERHSFTESSATPAQYTIMLMASISPNGSQVVEIEWQRETGAETCSCYERNMIMIEMDTANIKQAIGTADDTSTTADTDELIDDMTITDPGIGDWLVMFNTYDLYGSITSPAGLTNYKIYEGGAEDTNLTRIFEHEDSIDAADMSLYLSGRQTLGASTDDIQAYWNANSTFLRTIHTRTLIAMRDVAGINWQLSGVTYDKDGDILASVECYLWKDNGDNTLTWLQYKLSDGSGAYAFSGIATSGSDYMVTFVKDDTPHVMDVSDHILTPFSGA